MVVLENDECRATIDEHGAELTSFYSKALDREYLWDGSGAWHRHAPVLFPVVGGLAEGAYLVDGERYELPAHGFARDMEFEVVEAAPDRATLRLSSTPETRAVYPFDFAFSITYELRRSHLRQVWRVENAGDRTMRFSVGAHPAFKLKEGTELESYSLLFDREFPLRTVGVEGRLVTREKREYAEPADHLDLAPEVFANDTFIMQEGVSGIELTNGTDYRVDIRFPGFPAVAVWTPATDAGFVCVEPWYGINDHVGDGVRELAEKDLIQTVEPGGTWRRSLSYEILEPLTLVQMQLR